MSQVADTTAHNGATDHQPRRADARGGDARGSGARHAVLNDPLRTLAPDGRRLDHDHKLVLTCTERLEGRTGDADGPAP